jgi:hypothetical protein
MNIVRKIAVTAAAAAIATGGALAVVGAAAATSSSHTIKLTAVTLKSSQVGNSFVQAEKDLQKGRITGYDSVSCALNAKTHKIGCDGSFARADGQLYVHATVAQNGHGSGTVTGGTRAYKGATGTVMLAPGANQNQTRITITYTH